MSMRSILLSCLLLVLAAPAQAQLIAITDTTVYAKPEQKLEHATVLVRDGRIEGVGSDVKVPEGARVIDGRGKVVTAGLVEPFSQVGLVTVELEPAAVDGHFEGDLYGIHAAFRTRDTYDGRAVTLKRGR